MNKYYVVSEKYNLSETDKIYEKLEYALLNKSLEMMTLEHGIKPSSGILTDADSKKKRYTLIERYENQFANLDKKVFLICINSQDINEAQVIGISEIENLYHFLDSNNNFELISNGDIETKSWLNVPSSNIDIIQKSFMDSLEKDNEDRIESINKLKRLFPNSVNLIKRLESFIFRIPVSDATDFLISEVNENNSKLYNNIKEQQKEHGNCVKKLILKAEDRFKKVIVK